MHGHITLWELLKGAKQYCANQQEKPGTQKAERPVYAVTNNVEGKIAITKRLDIATYKIQTLVVVKKVTGTPDAFCKTG